jgi:hypothetical protein
MFTMVSVMQGQLALGGWIAVGIASVFLAAIFSGCCWCLLCKTCPSSTNQIVYPTIEPTDVLMESGPLCCCCPSLQERVIYLSMPSKPAYTTPSSHQNDPVGAGVYGMGERHSAELLAQTVPPKVLPGPQPTAAVQAVWMPATSSGMLPGIDHRCGIYFRHQNKGHLVSKTSSSRATLLSIAILRVAQVNRKMGPSFTSKLTCRLLQAWRDDQAYTRLWHSRRSPQKLSARVAPQHVWRAETEGTPSGYQIIGQTGHTKAHGSRRLMFSPHSNPESIVGQLSTRHPVASVQADDDVGHMSSVGSDRRAPSDVGFRHDTLHHPPMDFAAGTAVSIPAGQSQAVSSGQGQAQPVDTGSDGTASPNAVVSLAGGIAEVSKKAEQLATNLPIR